MLDGQAAPVAPPREWWQVWAERRARWLAERPTLARRLRLARTVLAWLTPVYLLVMLALQPDLRLAVQAWLGATWVVVAWFFLARTKTLTWSGVMKFFTVCSLWSMVTGAMLLSASASLGAVRAAGASTFIAGIGEEALKLAPLVALALLAPRRVSRFSTVDFALLGLVSGAAFQGVEETLRRIVFTQRFWYTPGDPLPSGWVHYGLWPIPSDITITSTEPPVVFGGHAILTALVAGTAGLAVVAWRSVRDRSAPTQVAVRGGALLVPMVVLVTMMSDHLACNARLGTGDAWLEPGSAVPWWLRVPWEWFGQAQYRPAMFVLLVVVCLAVDGSRLAIRATNLVPGPPPGWVERIRTGLSAWQRRSRWLTRAVAASLLGLLAAMWITGRDLRQTVLAHTREPGEPRLAAVRRAAAAPSGQRTARELGMEHHAGAIHPWRTRLIGAGLLAGLFIAALVIAPWFASHTGSNMQGDWSWLSGLLDDLSQWWGSLSPGQQILIGVGAGLLVGALPGMSLGLAFGIAGVATWGLDKSAGIATFIRNPTQATRDYITDATPAQVAADTLGVALTFGPWNFAGATVGRGASIATREFARDPAAARAAARARMNDEGAARWPQSGRPRRGDWEDWADDLADQGATGTQRPRGQGDGGMPGSNVAQNAQAKDARAAVEHRLGRELRQDEIEQVHDIISRENMDYQQIVDELYENFRPPTDPL